MSRMPKHFPLHSLILPATVLALGFSAASTEAGDKVVKVRVEKRKEVKRNYLPPPPPPPCLLAMRIREWLYNSYSTPYLQVFDSPAVRVVGPVDPPRTPPRLPIIIEKIAEPVTPEEKEKKDEPAQVQTILPPPGPTPMEELMEFFRDESSRRGDDKALGPYFDPSFQIAVPPPIPPTQSSATYQRRE